MRNLVPTSLAPLGFTPVPRKHRYDGWTPERQRAFIAALAQTGSVKAATRRINMSAEGAYYLRAAPGAESFRAAWEAALAHGVQNLTDLAIERATEGTPVPVYFRGEQVGEKRWFDNKLLMFILRHHLPDRYGTTLNGGTRSRATIEREAAENCPVCKERAATEAQAAADAPSEEARRVDIDQQLFGLYASKVEAERRHRVAGEVIAADFTLRQLTHLEVMLDGAGLGVELMDRWTTRPSDWGGTVPVHVSEISAFLASLREAFWAHIGAPVRPALRVDPEQSEADTVQYGPTRAERAAAASAAQQRIAAAQAEWEAATTEKGWAAWRERAGKG